MRRKIAGILAVLMMMMFSGKVLAITFSDLTEEHWAYENIMTLTNEGIINGYEDGTYRPENPVTRGEFFKLIVTSVETQENLDTFYGFLKPLLPHWASIYSLYLENHGYIMAETDMSELDINITRLEMAVIIAKLAIDTDMKNYEVDYFPETLTDLNELSQENRLYVEHVVNLGIIKGYEDKTFRPHQNMTRAEVATVIKRVLERK